MRIHAKIKDLNREFKFDAPSVLEEIFDKCIDVKKLFSNCNGALEYGYSRLINHEDSRLRKVMSQIDKFGNKHGIKFTKKEYKIKHTDPRLKNAESQITYVEMEQIGEEYDSMVFDYVNSLKILIRTSMYKRKNIELICYKD